MEQLYQPTGPARAELIVRKSRFIAFLEPIGDGAETKPIVEKLREEYRGARHVAHAYSVGLPSNRQFGMSDDGEPKGTAGKPILEILKGARCSNALVSVVRFFGGIKLGTGGLVRAYGDAARAALDEAAFVAVVARMPYTVDVDYDQVDIVVRVLEAAGAAPLRRDYGMRVTLAGEIPTESWEFCAERLRNSSNGRVVLERRIS